MGSHRFYGRWAAYHIHYSTSRQEVNIFCDFYSKFCNIHHLTVLIYVSLCTIPKSSVLLDFSSPFQAVYLRLKKAVLEFYFPKEKGQILCFCGREEGEKRAGPLQSLGKLWYHKANNNHIRQIEKKGEWRVESNIVRSLPLWVGERFVLRNPPDGRRKRAGHRRPRHL